MSDIVIKAENLGKKYTIGHQAGNGRYVALRDVVMQNARSFWRVTKDLVRGKPIVLGDDLEEVWALRDVSFEIRRGEAVGIIGRNGAGKSTLLKVLSRITEPSAGRVTIKGRVASLLEVGTGFHPELTGRENIYLNGAILGMTRAEIRRKLDEIVDFSGVEKFLDTPVKRYSSGMYVRLAFAVAAHLEPEILLVDEVLAVGDAEFQKKCLGKMGEVVGEGRTVLFVSHQMHAISTLCREAIWLDGGAVRAFLPSSDAVESYLSHGATEEPVVVHRIDERKPVQGFYLKLLNSRGDLSSRFPFDEGVTIEFSYTVRRPTHALYLVCFVHASDGTSVLFSDSRDHPDSRVSFSVGTHCLSLSIPGQLLAPGRYFASVVISHQPVGRVDPERNQQCPFEIVQIAGHRSTRKGFVALPLPWTETGGEHPGN
ncbi:MAG: ABC transporter ATP-binding protein [Chloroflexi bacterium]|nr:ABC transporter ATP-binding protein [Chloroflexota bacterium]